MSPEVRSRNLGAAMDITAIALMLGAGGALFFHHSPTGWVITLIVLALGKGVAVTSGRWFPPTWPRAEHGVVPSSTDDD